MAQRGRRRNAMPIPEVEQEVNGNVQQEHITYGDIEGIVGHYNGDDNKNAARWLDSFEEIAALARLGDLQKYIYCRRLLKGSVKSVIDTVGGITNYQEMKQIFLNEFGGEVNVAQLHQLCKNRKKTSNETSKQYYIAMKELGVGLEPELIMQYVIEGIDDDEMNKVMLYGVKSGAQFNDKLELYDMIKRKKIETRSLPIENENMLKTTSNRFHPYQKPVSTRLKLKCYHCDREGHTAQQCRLRDMTCFHCRKRGHVALQCPERGTKSSYRNSEIVCYNCQERGHISRYCTKPYDVKKEKQNTVGECTVTDVSRRLKQIDINGITSEALIDTGSDINLIRYDEYIRIKSPMISLDNIIQFKGVGNAFAKTLGYFHCEIIVDNENFNIKMHLTENKDLPVKIILGHEFLKDVEACFVEDTVKIRKVNFALPIITIDLNEIELSHIKNKQAADGIRNCVLNYKPLNIKKSPIETKIVLKDDVPVASRYRRMAESEQREVNEQINEWIKDGTL